MDAMQDAGMTPMQVIASSTTIAAQAMGLGGSTGTLDAGMNGDLLILGADPTVTVANFRKLRYVMRGGVLRPISELSALARNPQQTKP
jgi:imidazolonepropionase-like amidohydrolase